MLYNVGLIHFAVCFDSEEHRAKITLTCIFLLWRLNVLFFPPLSSISQYSAKLAHLAPSVWWWKRLLRVMWCFWCWSTPGRSFERPKLRSKSTILMSVFMAPGSSNWCWYANSDCKKKKRKKRKRISALWTDFKTALRLRLLTPNRPSDIWINGRLINASHNHLFFWGYKAFSGSQHFKSRFIVNRPSLIYFR